MPDHERLNHEARLRLRRQLPVFLREDVGRLLLPVAATSWTLAVLILPTLSFPTWDAPIWFIANAWAGFVTKLSLAQRRTRWLLLVAVALSCVSTAIIGWRTGAPLSALLSAPLAAGPLGMLVGVGVGRFVYKRALIRSVRQQSSG